MKKVLITADNSSKGRVALVVEEGTFNCFGKVKKGVRVDAGKAAPLVIEEGGYEYIGEDNYKEADDCFKTI